MSQLSITSRHDRFNIAQMGIIGSLTRPSPVTIFVYGLQAPNAASR